MPLGFRVIDTQNMCITKPDEPVNFVALSYMWASGSDSSNSLQLEKNNVRGLELPGGLAAVSLPDIISDAISLCRDLGERYLWIDRFCIIQDDGISKPAQIAAMDKIYRSASLAIIAALNDRTGVGLPGYANRPRSHYSSWFRPPLDPEVEGRGTKANGIKAIINASVWNKRGWTFQERILSKRRLFITEYQAIFECSCSQAEEEFTWADSRASRLTLSHVETPNYPIALPLQDHNCSSPIHVPGLITREESRIDAKYFLTAIPDFKDYCYWVENYSSRQLSFGTDIINAFAGISNVLGDAFETPVIFGLPEKYIAQSVVWSCHGSVARRGEMARIPSWSWASCLNVVDYHWINHQAWLDNEELIEIASIVIFHYQDPENGLRKLGTEERWMENLMSIDDVASQTELPSLDSRILTGKYRKAIPGDWRTNLIWSECPHNPWEIMAHKALNPDALRIATAFPGALVFNTTVASLRIGLSKRDSTHDTNSEVYNVTLHNDVDDYVGSLNEMSREWAETRQDSEGNRSTLIAL